MNRRSLQIFISSDMRELSAEREIACEALLEAGHSPLAFELSPALSNSATRAYIEAVGDCDIFVAILWTTLRPAVIDEIKEAVRLHKPILLFIKALNDDQARQPNLKEFLDTVRNPAVTNSQELQDKLALYAVYKDFRTLAEWRTSLRESIGHEIAKLFSKPKLTMNPIEMYDLGTEIIKLAKRRLYLFQKTPSLLLGPRPYGQPREMAIRYEKEFIEALESWIDTNCSRQDCEFYYLFSAKETCEEIEKIKKENPNWLQDFVQKVRQKIGQFKQIEKKHPGSIFIGMPKEARAARISLVTIVMQFGFLAAQWL